MSGICGIASFDGSPVDADLLARMVRACKYRAVHGSSVLIAGEVGFAALVTRTLADRQMDTAPLHDRERGVVLAADVRLDNRRELAAHLGLPHRDPACTDGRILLKAYECWGAAFFSRLTGDFAIALWDAGKRALLLARDPVGARPLYYARAGAAWMYAPDTAALLENPRVSKDIDGSAIVNLLAMNLRPRERTMFVGVRRLLPGHAIQIREGRPTAWRHWSLEGTVTDESVGASERVDQFRELLVRATADRLSSLTGGVAVSVSGGLDSSSVAAVARTLVASRKLPVKVTGVNYYSTSSRRADEREFVLPLHDELGLEIYLDDLDNDIVAVDDIVGAAVADGPEHLPGVGSRRLYRRARALGADVLLNGVGGDALFDAARLQVVDLVRRGSLRQAWPWARAARARGASLSTLLLRFLVEPSLSHSARVRLDSVLGRGRYWHPPRWLAGKAAAVAEFEWEITRARPGQRGRPQARERHRLALEQLAQQELVISVNERCAAAAGLSVRMPLLDVRLARLAYATRMQQLAGPGRGGTKLLLREAMRGILPERIRTRTGKGSWGELLAAEQRRLAGALGPRPFVNGYLESLGIVDGARLSQVCLGCQRHEPRFQAQIAAALALEHWLRFAVVRSDAVTYTDLEAWQREQGV